MKNSQERAAVARQSDARTTSKHDVNLSKNNVVYFQIGLIVALILAIVVIEIKSPATVYEPEVLPDVAVLTMDEWNEPIRREEVKPKPPKPIESFDVPPVIDENVPEPIDDLIFEEPEPVTEAVPGLEDLKDIQLEMINRFGLFPPELKILFFETEISLSAIPQNIKEIKVTNDEIKISYLDSSKDKRLKKGVDFEDNLKKIYKEINFTAKAS